jgi:hypothetical protein
MDNEAGGASPGDRRLQSLVYELDKKVHALELSDATHKLELAFLKGEIVGIRSTTASSFEVKAASELINANVTAVSAKVDSNDKLMNERLDQIRKDFSGMRAILLWCAATVIGAIIAAVQFKLVVIQ